MVNFSKLISLLLVTSTKSQTTTVDFDYALGTAGFDILTNFISDSSFINDLMDHGCWCAKLDPDNIQFGLGGKNPVDDLDTLCKHWIQSRACTRLAGSSCENYSRQPGSYNYQVQYENDLTDAFCPDNDQCLSETCQIDLFYVRKIVDWKNANVLTPVTSPSCELSIIGQADHSYCIE